jgi:hypothetical protein
VKKAGAVTLLVLMISLLQTGGALAVALPGNIAGSVGISPSFQNVSIAKNQAQAHYFVTLTNLTSHDQAFKLSVEDFGSLNESGGVAFLGTSSSAFARKYGLSAWLTLDQGQVTVPAGQSEQIGVTLNNSASLTPGGHYGAILATELAGANGSAAQLHVGVLAVLSSLILLIKEGGPPPNLVLVGQTVDKSMFAMPTTVSDRFENLGNVHVVPRGLIQVTDPWGRAIDRGSINVNSGIILPSMFRRYDTPLVPLATAIWPGRYTVATAYRYDGTTATKPYTTTFWYAGSPLLWVGVVLLVGVAAGVLWLWRRFFR